MLKKTIAVIQFVIISISLMSLEQMIPMSLVENTETSINSSIYVSTLFDDLKEMQKIQEEQKRIADESKIRVEQARIKSIIDENNRKDNVCFDPYNLNTISNITENELNQIFIAIGKSQMCELSATFVQAEKDYKINALFLAGIVALESGWLKSPAGNGDNVTGYCVYNPEYKGATFGGSRHDNIMQTTSDLRKNYLTPGAIYYDNGYSIWNVNTRYCLYTDQKTPNYKWSSDIVSIANNFVSTYHNSIKTLEEVPSI